MRLLGYHFLILRLLCSSIVAHQIPYLVFYIPFRKERKSNEVFEYTFNFGAAWIIMPCNHHLGNGYYMEPDGFLPWKAYESIFSLRRLTCSCGAARLCSGLGELSATCTSLRERPAPRSLLVSAWLVLISRVMTTLIRFRGNLGNKTLQLSYQAGLIRGVLQCVRMVLCCLGKNSCKRCFSSWLMRFLMKMFLMRNRVFLL